MGFLVTRGLSIRRSCRSIRLSRTAWYRRPADKRGRDTPVIEVLNDLIENRPRRGFWKCFKLLRRQGHGWNHKRVHRIYCQMGLNQRRRTRRRVPTRDPRPLAVPDQPNQVWSADFMSDALYGGVRFRTFNVMDHFNREAVAIEVDTSITGSRLIRVFEQLQTERGLPGTLRVDNGPEFMGTDFSAWAREQGMTIEFIEPGQPNQNAFIERFNRTFREEVLDAWIFYTLEQVREMTWDWISEYNEIRPHDSLGDRTPAEHYQRYDEKLYF